MNLFRTPAFLPWLYPQLEWRVNTSGKDLYLTFDDGPVPGPTEFVLDVLKKHNADATFFCIGDNVVKHPSIFQMVTQAGHAVGNHTFNHLSGWKTSTEAYLQNIKLCQDSIESGTQQQTTTHEQRSTINHQRTTIHLQPATNNEQRTTISERHATLLFRPPYGRITRKQIQALHSYRIVMWDVLTHDYAQSLSPEKCLKGALKAARPGSVVVFHDSLKAERNMKYVLPRFMDHFGGLGYSFKSLI